MADLSTLIRAVEEADSASLLTKAVQNLAAAGLEASVPTLIAALSYNNPGAAVAAVDGLVTIGQASIPALLEQLDQHNYTARSWTIRALAGIGDPRGLVTLLGGATADFSPSVRRAAARGLGALKWQWFPADLLEMAQAEALEALLFVAQQDEEWVVRYAAVVGLQALAGALTATYPEWRLQIHAQFEQMAIDDQSWAVRARILMAQQQIQASTFPLQQPLEVQASPLSEVDWQVILESLYKRKGQERLVLSEGDPRSYQAMAVAIAQETGTPSQLL